MRNGEAFLANYDIWKWLTKGLLQNSGQYTFWHIRYAISIVPCKPYIEPVPLSNPRPQSY